MKKGNAATLGTPAYLQQVSLFKLWFAAVRRVRRWQQVHRERQELASLSDRALVDIGLHRYDVEAEARRPFWDDPLRK